MAAFPLLHASHNGVEPSRFAAFGFAPALSSSFTISLSGPEHCPVKRSRPVGLRSVYVGVLCNSALHGARVPEHGRICNLGGAGAEPGDRQQQQDGTGA